jgi:putative membrane protein
MADFHLGTFVNALIYAITGVVIFALCFALLDKMTPFHLWKEICEDKNVALGVVVGAAILGICIIIAAAIH